MNIFGILLDHILKDEPDKEELKSVAKIVFADKPNNVEEAIDGE